MKKLLLSMVMSAICYAGISQDKTLREIQQSAERSLDNDTTHKSGWRRGGVFSLGIGQGSSRNWAAGAEKFSFSLATNLSVFANLKSGRYSWRNALDLSYALVNTTSQGNRKTDDKIDFFSKAGYDLSRSLSLAGVFNFRSQFYDGFDYDYLGKGLQRTTSKFLAPAYIIIAPGFDWHPYQSFSVFISPVSARFVIVANDPKSYFYENGDIPDSVGGGFEKPLSVLYGVDPARKIRAEVGGFASINFFKEVFKNVTLKSRLDLYSNYLKREQFTVTGPDELQVMKIEAHPEKVDVFWTNVLVMQINEFLNVSYNFDLIYDDDVRQFGENNTSAAVQFRSQLTVGVSAKF
jgi:hypothetical protein